MLLRGSGYPTRVWIDPNLRSLRFETSSMIDRQAGLGLPLVNHLVQQRVLNVLPAIPHQVPPADCNLDRTVSGGVEGYLTKPSPHAVRYPEWQERELTGEMQRVETFVQTH